MDYIFCELKKMGSTLGSTSTKTDKYSHESISLIREILESKYTSGTHMNTMLSLLDNMVLSQKIKKEYGFYHVEKWIGRMDRIDKKSAQSTVYISDILSIPVIIKSPKNKHQYNDLIREYYIGKTEINKLRYHIPNFMYTLGAFMYPDNKKTNTFIIYEKIPGDSLEKLIKENKLTFGQFLNIFIQILFALEVGQRNIRFCHYDLHAGNIVVRPISQPFTYTVVFDHKRYDITVTDYMPVIIDFGMATVSSKNKTIGSHYFSRYGMMHYLIQGADMYKLLFYSSLNSTQTNIHRSILELFAFYGQDDPYKFLNQKPGFLKKVSFEFAKQGSLEKSATYTPLDFVNWILEQYHPTCVTVSERNIFHPYSSQIFQQTESIFSLLGTNPSSYVLTQYIKSLLANHPDDLQRLQNLQKNRSDLLHGDKTMLMSYVDIKLPDQMKLRDYMGRIINTKINYKKDIRGLINNFLNLSNVCKKMTPYLQLLYTIKELQLDMQYKIYRVFVISFTTSNQYLFYKDFHSDVERCVRWSITLLEKSKA